MKTKMKFSIPILLTVLLVLPLHAQNLGGIFGPASSLLSGTANPATCSPVSRNVFFNRATGLLQLCLVANTWSAPAASTATALATIPTQCGANNFATGITTTGNANCLQPSAANLTNGTNGTGAVSLTTGPTIALAAASTVAKGSGTAAGPISNVSVSNTVPVSLPGGTTAENDLQTVTLPANTLTTGHAIRITIAAVAGADTATHTIRLYLGATLLGTLSSATSSGTFSGTWTIVSIGSNSQWVIAIAVNGAANAATASTPYVIGSALTVTDSTNQTIKVTGQTSVAAAADVISKFILVEGLN